MPVHYVEQLLMCVPFEIASFLQLEFLRGRFATTG